jgi:hypothetical protein
MPNLATHNPGIVLDYKAKQMILKALRHQLASWEAQTEEELGEDEYAIVQNDVLYLEGLLVTLQDEFNNAGKP